VHLLPEGQTGDAWKTSFGDVEALDRKVLSLLVFFNSHYICGLSHATEGQRASSNFQANKYVVLDILALLRCYVASIGSQLPVIQDTLSVPERWVRSYICGYLIYTVS
jgi:hypothetical protein